MEAYTGFAEVYDIFMDETPYEEWKKEIIQYIERYGVSKPKNEYRTAEGKLESERNLIVDLGCGTGTLTEMMASDGYDMIGVDNSQEMLTIAMEKRDKAEHETMYLLQDMRELELYSTVGTIICVCDSLNYLLEEDEILGTFRLVDNYLYPGGIFIFDFNTVYKYAEVIGDTTIAENREDCSFIWENFYHEDEQINEYDLTLFIRENELYRRFEEIHYQKGYTFENIKSLLKKSGMELLEAVDADTGDGVTDSSERIRVVAKECRKGMVI